MRLFCILSVTLLVATASADQRTVPFEIVNVLPETQQVLVYDKAHKTHVLLAPNSTFEDYVVVEISGIGVVVETKQERFTVYPRAAQGLALDLYKSNRNRLPAIYSTVEPEAVPVVARAPSDPKHARLGEKFASALWGEPRPDRVRLSKIN